MDVELKFDLEEMASGVLQTRDTIKFTAARTLAALDVTEQAMTFSESEWVREKARADAAEITIKRTLNALAGAERDNARLRRIICEAIAIDEAETDVPVAGSVLVDRESLRLQLVSCPVCHQSDCDYASWPCLGCDGVGWTENGEHVRRACPRCNGTGWNSDHE